jgi:hypothetical protein
MRTLQILQRNLEVSSTRRDVNLPERLIIRHECSIGAFGTEPA